MDNHTATTGIKQPLPKSGREMVRDLEDKVLVNAEHYYHNVMGGRLDVYLRLLSSHTPRALAHSKTVY